MKNYYLLLIGLVLTTVSANGQEIIPFPDLSEHYNFRNDGGVGIEETKYGHFPDDYQKALKAMDADILSMEKRLMDLDASEKESLHIELDDLKNKRSALIQEAELRSDLLKFY